ncbi:hypothetical protein CSQ85_05360 [Bifidobacterium rousetti]|uniref:transporter substrate-binding domain-containing protein n=1 Tax=Bifidobacterium rousetti TaxID=2045439 RepID=UPI0012396BF7|nr:transporter substrate-binding domain-containing protein [Bifidobacterium rousetti]KAA8819439.1 hypothetical protein CSQ85_05360 [Bifidobacterium rousetti]
MFGTAIDALAGSSYGLVRRKRSGMARRVIAAFVAALMIGSLGACTNTDAPKASGVEASEDSGTIKVVTTGTGTPFAWKDPDTGKLTGYYVDLTNAIDDKLPDVKVEWDVTDFAAASQALTTGQDDVLAFMMSKTPEREQRYLYSAEPVAVNRHVIIYDKSKFSGITSLDDVAEKKLKVGTFSTGASDQLLLEQYNKDHAGSPIDLNHGDYGITELVTAVRNGQIDATVVGDTAVYAYEHERHDDSLAIIPITSGEGSKADDGYYLFGRTQRGERAKRLFDKAIAELKADGTISDISLKYFGKDISGQ